MFNTVRDFMYKVLIRVLLIIAAVCPLDSLATACVGRAIQLFIGE